jgi:hypothetical protein
MTGKEYNNQFSKEELEKETWKDIPDYEGYYQVSNLGRVKSLSRFLNVISNKKRKTTERLLIPIFGDNGRFHVSLCKERKIWQPPVGKLVLLAFIGRPFKGTECCHGPDFDPTNNRLENLRWGTHSENMLDKVKNGTDCRGEKCKLSKLTWEKVHEIRTLHFVEKFTRKQLAKMFSVDKCTIGKIVTYKTWIK